MRPQRITPGLAGAPSDVDLVVVGLGVTGAGVALDAASRGLRVLAVDAVDLAFGTSRWSSKLVHGGLRYLASGQVGVAHESAVERGVLLEVTAPHLTEPMATLVPLGTAVGRPSALLTAAGLRAGDVLRRSAGTSSDTLPAPRRLDAAGALRLAPGLRREGLRGGLLGWDGRLEDDARLVVTIARTAAQHGAHVRTRARVVSASGRRVVLRDELSGAHHEVHTQAVVNAAGVWAGEIAPDVRLRPSRGTHLVLARDTLPGLRAGVFVPIPRTRNRFVLVLPQPDGRVYVGLTDEPVDGPVPDVPEPTEEEIRFLLEVAATAFERPLRRTDVVGAFAGLRPLLDTGAGATADLSRRHAVLTGGGIVSIVGGKLTTYRRMAEDAVDAALAEAGPTLARSADPCRTARLPLSGAAPRPVLAALTARLHERLGPGGVRLVRRFGADAEAVLEAARTTTGLDDEQLTAALPTAGASGVEAPTVAEIVVGITHEGAVDADDLLERRTRVGLVAADGAAARDVVQEWVARSSQWHAGAARGGDDPLDSVTRPPSL